MLGKLVGRAGAGDRGLATTRRSSRRCATAPPTSRSSTRRATCWPAARRRRGSWPGTCGTASPRSPRASTCARTPGSRRVEDLRGKTIAFVDPASSSGYIYPMVLLIQKGLVKNRDPKTFFREVVFSGAHDASMRALLNGHVDAIASFDMAREQYLKDPAERERIAFVAETPPIPEAGIAARDGLDPAVFAQGPRGAAADPRARRTRPCSSASTTSTGSSPRRTATTIPCARPSSCSASGRADRRRTATAEPMIEVAGLRVVLVPPADVVRRRRRSRVAAGRVRRRSSGAAAPARRRSCARSTGSSSPRPASCASPAGR